MLKEKKNPKECSNPFPCTHMVPTGENPLFFMLELMREIRLSIDEKSLLDLKKKWTDFDV